MYFALQTNNYTILFVPSGTAARMNVTSVPNVSPQGQIALVSYRYLYLLTRFSNTV